MILIIAFVLMLAACEQPVQEITRTIAAPATTPTETTEPAEPVVVVDPFAIQTSDGMRYVKNSNWEPVTLSTLMVKASASRAVRGEEITSADLDAIIDKANTASDDNQYFSRDADITAEEGPNCTVYVVNERNDDDELGAADDWIVLAEYKSIPRQDVKVRRQDWQNEAMMLGGLLFVDKTPPKPAPVTDERTDDEKYIIYLIKDKKIEYVEHCTETCAAPDFFTTSGYTSLKQYYQCRYEMIYRAYYALPGYEIIGGHYYTEPAS